MLIFIYFPIVKFNPISVEYFSFDAIDKKLTENVVDLKTYEFRKVLDTGGRNYCGVRHHRSMSFKSGVCGHDTRIEH